MVNYHTSLLGAALLLLGGALGDHSPPPAYGTYPQPQYPYPPVQAYYEEVCKLKEWSSDTEICQPGMAPQCEQDKFKVLEVVKGEPKCLKFKLPKCKTTNDAEEHELCSIKAEVKNIELEIDEFEAVLKKRCDTHYTTVCKPSYRGPPKCQSVPTHNCYDVPVLKPSKRKMKTRGNEVTEGCEKSLVPTPKTLCWDEEVEICTEVPELEEAEQPVSKCVPGLSEEECQRVRLTIPREICFHVQKFRPIYPLAYPAKH